MRARCGRRRDAAGGLTIIEVLVALTVLAVNALAVAGILVTAVDMTRRVEVIARTIEDGVSLPECAMMLVPQAVRMRRRKRSSAGFTLVEILVALALAGVALGIAIGFLQGGARTSAALTAKALDLEARIAIPAIVEETVSTAGAGVLPPGCGFGVAVDRSALVIARVQPDGTLRVEEVFAGSDGGGRPALYLRHRPYARQPWLEDVVGFEVVRVLEVADGRADAVELRIARAGAARPIDVLVALPHRPCLVDAP